MGRATFEILQELHGLVLDVILESLQEATKRTDCSSCGPAKGIPPQLFAASIKFLKDNGIDSPAPILRQHQVSDWDGMFEGRCPHE